MGKLQNNVGYDVSRKVRLTCGHETSSPPVVTFSGGRRLYQCPKGCGLIERKR